MPVAFILSAVRTPIGRFGGAFKDLAASQLGAVAIREALRRATVDAGNFDEVLLGNVIQAGQGQNPARQAARLAGVPDHVPAMTVNMVCASGLRTVAMAAQAIRAGEGELFIAGGIESMSQAPYVASSTRWGQKLGHAQLVDAVLRDGLLDAFDDRHMGEMAEAWATRYGITRAMQDEFALNSQMKCKRAMDEGKFADEIVEVQTSATRSTALRVDEHPRPDTTLERLGALKPAFGNDATITAGNAAGINDGAAALVIASEVKAKTSGVEPLARIVSYAWSAREPHEFGLAPAGAIQKALRHAGLSLDDLVLIECNEAFAVQVLALTHEVGWDLSKVNVNGGAIALGHPIGCSGARILVTLIHEMKRRGVRYGLATLCAGGGMGIAMVVERP